MSDVVLLPSKVQAAPVLDLNAINREWGEADATSLVQWGHDTFGDGLVLSTSFGIQSAVMLHLVTQVVPNIPVIWIDTGYLPVETYRFAEELSNRLRFNLKVYQSPLSPARMEALYGRLWEQHDVHALNRYDQIRKVEPMQRALTELNATAWLTGLRADQTDHRKSLERVGQQGRYYKLLPILKWTAKNLYQYLVAHDLPYHPLFDKGYVTVGDWHSSRPITAADANDRDTRFKGLKQECGLHLPQSPEEAASLDSSSLYKGRLELLWRWDFELGVFGQQFKEFRSAAIGLVDAVFPFADGLTAHAHFLRKLHLRQAHVLAQGADGVLLPNDFAVFLLDLVLGLKLAKASGLGRYVDPMDVVARPYPGTGLKCRRGIAVTPPVFTLAGRFGQGAAEQCLNLVKG